MLTRPTGALSENTKGKLPWPDAAPTRDATSTKRARRHRSVVDGSYVRSLISIEENLRRSAAGPRKRAAVRMSQSRPICQRLHRALVLFKKSRRYLPRSAFGQAIDYALSNWPLLGVYGVPIPASADIKQWTKEDRQAWNAMSPQQKKDWVANRPRVAKIANAEAQKAARPQAC